jgi:cytochrome c-type protein NapB
MRRKGLRRLSQSAPFAVALTGIALLVAVPALTQESARLSGQASPMESAPAAPVPKWITDDVRKMRAFPEQPPIIPHSIDGYQVTINANRCLSCHKREFTEASGAPMVSITHYMDRDGQMLADVSPRRYNCTACHVPQADVTPPVPNTFKDTSQLGARPADSE